ncbi:MAG: DUF3108 domain-containing protein [Hyphomicrobiaceae bacterium]
MSWMSRARKSAAVASLACVTATALTPATTAAEPSQPWPNRVHAVYKVTFNGFDVGQFEFNSSVTGSNYTLTGDAKLSALLGAFTWQGLTRTSGAIGGETPKPAGYTFSFNGTGRNGSIKMGFAGDAVTNVAHVPPHNPAPTTVPVREPHLKGVLDPLSAVMALSRTSAGNPCGRKLAIFDGKQRFDLVLSYKRQEHVQDTRPSGQPGVAYVCRVKYQPIAGHKVNDETRAMAASQGIEVSLRPIPSANLFVPHQIVIPTGAGTATLTAIRVQIVTPKNEQIALGH